MLKLASKKTIDPGRAELAAAIEAASAAEERSATARGAVERAHKLCDDAERKLRTATAAVQWARQQHASRLAEAIAAGGTAPASALRSVRQAHAEAEDDAAAARGALETLQREFAELAESWRQAQISNRIRSQTSDCRPGTGASRECQASA